MSNNYTQIESYYKRKSDSSLDYGDLCGASFLQGEDVTIQDHSSLNENFFKDEVIEIDLPQIFFFKPEYLCLQLYKTTDLWWFTLLINGMKNCKEFNTPKVKVLNPSSFENFKEFSKDFKRKKTEKIVNEDDYFIHPIRI